MPFGELMEQHRIGLSLVAAHRERLVSSVICGTIRHFSKRLILIETVGPAGRLDGFTLIRREDLTRVDVGTTPLRQALKLVGTVARNHPIARELDLLDWRTALDSARRVSPTLRLLREGIGDPITLDARSIQVTKHLVIGREPGSDDEGELALALDQLTRLDLVD